MATTGVVGGTLMAIYIAGNKIGALLTNNFSVQRPMRSTANKDDGIWESGIAGRAKWTAGGSALFKFDATYGARNIFAAILAGVAVTVRISTAVQGDYYYEGSGLITQFDVDSPDAANSNFNFSAEGSGAIAETIVP